jgi:hypothetical protein
VRNLSDCAASRVRPAHLLVESLIDLRYLGHPALSLTVFETEYLIARPVKVKGDIGYLLIEPV